MRWVRCLTYLLVVVVLLIGGTALMIKAAVSVVCVGMSWQTWICLGAAYGLLTAAEDAHKKGSIEWEKLEDDDAG